MIRRREQLTMRNKLKSCAILATLGTITIHLINKTLIEMATKDSLLNSSEGNYYDWRFGKIFYKKEQEARRREVIKYDYTGKEKR